MNICLNTDLCIGCEWSDHHGRIKDLAAFG